MCLKEDYYSRLGSNLHAAYNIQILVIQGFVFSYYVSQSRADINDFVATLDYFYELYGEYPKNVCADSGYGSLNN
jgi:putative ISCpe5, transposase